MEREGARQSREGGSERARIRQPRQRPFALPITDLDGEPRVLDTDLAAELGFARPRTVRELIERSRDELESYGPLAVRHGESRGQEFDAFYLNRDQALLVCILSRTEKAKAVRAVSHDQGLASHGPRCPKRVQ